MVFTSQLSETTTMNSSQRWWEHLFFPQRLRDRIADKLMQVFESGAYRHFTAPELARNIGVLDIHSQYALDKALRQLALERKIEQVYPGKFRLRGHCPLTGVVDLSSSSGPMLLTGENEKPVYISYTGLRGASHGDTVLVNICRVTPQCLEATVSRILRFAQREMTGTLEVSERRAYFVPFNRNPFYDIEIPLKKIKNAVDGDSVLIKLHSYTQWNKRRVTGKVVRILSPAEVKRLNNPNQPRPQSLLSTKQSKRFYIDVTPEEEAAAAAIRFDITEEEIAKRLDMREVMTFTIDPAGTQDVDDALSIRILENGNFEAGIHIADVSHYVKPGSILDTQAYERSTSIYMANQVLTMFPDSVTHGCSLFPKEDKLAFSVIVEMDGEARIIKKKIAKTVICSQRQFSYDEAQQLIDNPTGDILSKSMNALFALSQKMRNNRMSNGAVTFNDRSQLCFEMDDNGNTINISPYKRITSMKMIEEFMLLANRTVAETAAKRHIPFIYRSHDNPKMKMFSELCNVAANYGFEYKGKKYKRSENNPVASKNISQFLSQVKTSPEESLFTCLSVRSMAQAKYGNEPKHHFALAFDYYTHFTSPIRRYVDVAVHRLINQALINPDESAGNFDFETACKHFNDKHQKAKTAQQQSVQQKSAKFLHDKIGQVFEGIITNANVAQMSVELTQTGVHGRLPLRSLMDDQYRLDNNTYIIRGSRTGKCYKIGDRLQVRVASVETDRGLINFVPA
ncbi:MAG: VacB/RNase II family 3'-5' exoribonuclease [Candidatus Symbiothrix sp.]|jgi:ribonuclease R|nr:VacB/RNase II family 3'-5' exoribonuclease [Candidatus Symbiothrix sp.]